MQHALIVEDLPEIRHWLGGVLAQAFPQVHVQTASRRSDALALVTQQPFDLALIDLGLPDGSGVDVVGALRTHQPKALSVVVTIHADDAHLFPALQAGAFGYLLKEQAQDEIVGHLLRMTQGEPPLSPSIARRVLAYFQQAQAERQRLLQQMEAQVTLTERETDVLQRVAKGYTLQEIATQFQLSRFTVNDYVKSIYRKLNVSSRAQAALEAVRRGLVQP
jgi:DNA-binding NarL/FixJ family response regulator